METEADGGQIYRQPTLFYSDIREQRRRLTSDTSSTGKRLVRRRVMISYTLLR